MNKIEREALERLINWAQAQAPKVEYSGDHPIRIVRKGQ